MYNISDAPANVWFALIITAALLGLRFSPKPLCAVWEAHDRDILREMALETLFLAGWGFLGCCSPWGGPHSAHGFCFVLNSSPANAADVFLPSPALQREIKINDLGLLRAQLCVLLDTHWLLLTMFFWLKSESSAAAAQPSLGWVMGVLGNTPWRSGCSTGDV